MRFTLLFISFSIFFTTAYSQRQDVEEGETNFLYVKNIHPVDELEYKDIAGNPYSDEQFHPSIIMLNSGTRIENLPVRYNWYTRDMEFKRQDEILVMPESKDIAWVDVDKVRYVPFFYLKEVDGFLIELLKGEYSLFRKDQVEFINATPPSSGYDTSHPAQFKWGKPAYYIITEDGRLIRIEQNKKKLPEQFNKKEKVIIASLIQENKLNPKKEEDLIRLISLLNEKSGKKSGKE